MIGSDFLDALDHKCPSCGAAIKFSPKEQKWVCEYCASKFTLAEMKKHKNASSDSLNQKSKEKKSDKVEEADVYRCKSCGAEIIADVNTTATFCVYCGNTAILKEKIQNSRVPDYIIPFQKVKEDATSAFLQLVKHKPLVPRTFKSRKNIDKITGVYIPFWAYDFDVSGTAKFKCIDTHTWSDYNTRYTKTDTFDVVSFCEEKGIDTTNDLAVARLFQVEDYLEAAYNDALSNGDSAEALKDPSHLYVVANRFARERELNKGGMSL